VEFCGKPRESQLTVGTSFEVWDKCSQNTGKTCEVCGSHGGHYEQFYLLVSDAK
jgi:hypothetical protein